MVSCMVSVVQDLNEGLIWEILAWSLSLDCIQMVAGAGTIGCSGPSLRNLTMSLLLYSTGQNSHKSPPSFTGSGHGPHLSMGRESRL